MSRPAADFVRRFAAASRQRRIRAEANEPAIVIHKNECKPLLSAYREQVSITSVFYGFYREPCISVFLPLAQSPKAPLAPGDHRSLIGLEAIMPEGDLNSTTIP